MKKKKFKNHYVDRYYKFISRIKGWEVMQLNEGWLYYDSPDRYYATKIKPSDLPEDYMNYWDGGKQNYLKTSGVVDIVYQPVINNHVFRDDSLYISYTNKIKYKIKDKWLDKDERFTKWLDVEEDSYNNCERIWGGEIIEFLLMAEKYSGYDISSIKEQMWNKMLLLKKYEPETYNSQVRDRETFDSWFNLERFDYKNKK